MKNSNSMSAAPSTSAVESSVSSPPRARRKVATEAVESLKEFEEMNAAERAALDEAMEDLADLDEYAAEKGLPPPATRAKESARVFLRKVVREAPRVFAVSPWDNGKVVVHTRGAKGFGVGVYFNAEGGASCYVTRPKGEGEERHYSRADGVPDEFILAALRGLGE